jgi:putative nucleotidyltransferase with HDIG domain
VKELALSRVGRAFVLAVVALGGGLILSSMVQLVLDATNPYWVVLAVLTLFTAPLSLRVPSVRATVTVTETFVFASALLFGPAAATVTVALDGLMLSVWGKRRNVHRALFNVGEPAISVWVAAQLFYVVSGVEPLFGSPVGLGQLLMPLLLLTTSYFVVNTVLIATALWFETRTSPLPFLRDQAVHTGLNYFACCSFVVLLVLNLHNLTFAAVGVFVPLLVLSYASSKLSTARVEEANGHLNQLSHLYLSTIEALALAIDAKDQVTSGHIRRVQLHSVALAHELGMTDQGEIRAIEAAALLHDLGKLAVPEHILNKPGKLTSVEFDQMKTHATIGADILATIDFPYPVEPIVRHHHEMWDGKGYPDGISGETIPIGARILSVVDCFDALTSDRPYRLALTKEQAIAVLVERRGTQYDPRVVDTFIAVCDSLIDSCGAQDRSGQGSFREAEIREVVAPRLPAEVELPAAVRAEIDDTVGPDDEDWTPGVDGRGCVLPTFQAISSYLETVAPEGLCVLYRHVVDEARLVVSHVSSPEHEFLLRDLSMPLGDRLTGWVGANRQMILNSDPGLDLGDMADAWHPRLLSCFAMPLVWNDILVGVLSVYSADEQGLSRRQTRTVSMLVKEGLERVADRSLGPTGDPVLPPVPRPRPMPVRPRVSASLPA